MASTSTVASSIKESPGSFQRLHTLLKDDKRDLISLLIYAVLTGLLMLAIPLAAQALINTIAAGVFLQPLVVLTLILFVSLIFVGILRVAQFYVVEILQQRAFARVALNLAEKVPFIQHQALMTEYPPELLNRFFDVIKVQKTMSKLLLEGPVTLLQIIAGLLLIGVYSPFLLGFDLFILSFIAFTAFILGKNAVSTSIAESSENYKVAGWLEELARCQVSFKIDADPAYLFNKADSKVVDYIRARNRHFRILFRQAISNYFFQAVAVSGVLGIGGWLVINRQLTLGQLVASELVMFMLLAAIDKLIIMFQDWYDLLTAIEKIGHVTDLPIERKNGKLLPSNPSGATVKCLDVCFHYNLKKPILKQLNLSITSGELVSIVGVNGAGKSTLAAILCGLLDPGTGLVEINGIDIRDVELISLRKEVGLVSDNLELFDGTLEENILVGRAGITEQDMRWALKTVQLLEEIPNFPNGLQTPVVSAGRNLSRGQIQRMMIARAIVDKPKLLILDEAFTGIDELNKIRVLDALLSPENQWTIIDISHDAEVVMRSHRVLVLDEGAIRESGSPLQLAEDKNSFFATLFPDLSDRNLRRDV